MENTFRVIVAGGRDFFDYNLLCKKLDIILSTQEKVIIVSGNARGADSLGERYAKEHGILISYFPASWAQYGSKAGFIRNEEMAKYADACICFWNGESSGTADMIRLAKEYNLKLRVINY